MTASQWSTTEVGRDIAPEIANRTERRSAPRSRAASASAWYIGGTPGRKVAGRRAMASSACCASKRGNSTRVAPMLMAKVRHRVRP